jgi:hypothetical protein
LNAYLLPLKVKPLPVNVKVALVKLRVLPRKTNILLQESRTFRFMNRPP